MTAVDEVRQRVDIVSLIGNYAALQKSGRSFKALCPFHSEKTPSFYVFPETQRWHCFGACATGGDVFSFIMKRENLTFADSLRFLAQRAGIRLAERAASQTGKHERLYQACEAAARFFHSLLLKGEEAAHARVYLETRGLSQESVETFLLGLSPDSWDSLKKSLTSRGFQEGELIEAGLLSPRESGGSYDRFRGRLMFPIWNEEGRVCGFGARALDSSMPKYLNSPQTPIFDKGALLYGLHKAREAVHQAQQAVIVEGYMDVIMAHQFGFRNVVAPMGTALTEKQVSLLKRLTPHISLALDADAAGQEATFRSLQESWHVFHLQPAAASVPGISLFYRGGESKLSVVTLPQGKDPDEVIHQDPQTWETLTKHPDDLLDYLMGAVAGRMDIGTPAGKAAVAERLYPLIAGVANNAEQDAYLQKLAQLLDVDRSTLRAAMGRPRRSQRGPASEIVGSAFQAKTTFLEDYGMALLLRSPSLREKASAISADLFSKTENREIFTRWLESDTLEALQGELDLNLAPYLDQLLLKDIPPLLHQRDLEKAFADVCRRLKETRLRSLKAQESLILAQDVPADPEERQQLEQKMLDLNQRLEQVLMEGGKRPWRSRLIR